MNQTELGKVEKRMDEKKGCKVGKRMGRMGVEKRTGGTGRQGGISYLYNLGQAGDLDRRVNDGRYAFQELSPACAGSS